MKKIYFLGFIIFILLSFFMINTVQATTTNYETRLNLDYPKSNYIDTESIEINGWVLSTCKDRKIQILLDGKIQNLDIITRERPDVLKAISGYGGIETNSKPGFKANLDIKNIKDGNHILVVKILTNDGVVLAEELRNLTIQKYQSILNLDYPKVSNINNDIMEINGWNLSTCKDRKIQIFIDGKIQNANIAMRERPDVLKVISGYGGIETNAKPGFKTILDLKNILDGKHNLTVKIVSTNGEILVEESRNIIINKYQSILHLDYPKLNNIDDYIMEINGWNLSTCKDRKIQIFIDGKIQNANIETRERPDVLKVISGYGGIETNAKPGFKTILDLKNISDGEHNLKVEILTNNGEFLAQEIKKLNIHKYSSYLNIDLPSNHVDSTQLEINGWVMSNYKDKIIEVKLDGIAQNVVTRERPDVIKAIQGYGGVERNPKPGFKVLTDISNLKDGIHKFSVRILTKEGNVLIETTREFKLVKYPTMIYVDTPTNGYVTGKNSINLSGWIMSTVENVTIKMYLNDKLLNEKISRRARPDVINAVKGYGDITTNPTPGFSTEILLNDYSEGNYTIRIVAEKENGSILTVSTIKFTIDRTILRGIDVSEHQGIIDWNKVKNNVDFVIIRCGYGEDNISQDDKQFLRNISECKRLNIPYGIYIYSYAVNIDKAISEAKHVRRLLVQAGEYKTPEYGIWFDMESDNYKNSFNVTKETYIQIAQKFISEMNGYGYNNIGIYANLYWWHTILNDVRLDKYTKWVAQYNSQCDYEKDYIMWQYTDNGYVDGISGQVDKNYYYCNRK